MRVEQLGDELFAAELLVGGPARERTVKAALGDGLGLAHRYASPILVGEEVVARLGLGLAKHGSLEAVLEAAAARAGIPLPTSQPDVERVARPRNLRFAEGLRHWDLRGSFLHDMSGAHWQGPRLRDRRDGRLARGAEPRAAGVRRPAPGDPCRRLPRRAGAAGRRPRDRRRPGPGRPVPPRRRPRRSRGPEQRQQATLAGTRDWTRERVEPTCPTTACSSCSASA